MNPSGSASARRARCPRCGTPVAWAGNPNRPFCSLTCRLIDLGAWLDERYRIPGPELPDDVVAGTRARYAEAFELLTGLRFDHYLADPQVVLA